jgi:hypothetical protein
VRGEDGFFSSISWEKINNTMENMADLDDY